MNIQDYIASGIIEQYVLGDVSTQEKKEVECMSHIYPEIAEAVLHLQQTLEGLAMQEAVDVPKQIKERIFKIIAEEAKTIVPTPSTTKIVNLPLNTPVNNINYKTYLQVAAAVFVIATSAIVYFINNSNSKTQTALNNKIDSLQKNVAITKQQLAEQSLLNSNAYVLPGNNKAPKASLTVIWNKETGNVYVSNVTLPKTPINKQYQLWGIKDGKPIDLGVFDVTNVTQAMKQIKGMQAFAVTLEDKGGKPIPNLAELHAILTI
jgi:anti-sigma-K factor RskA